MHIKLTTNNIKKRLHKNIRIKYKIKLPTINKKSQKNNKLENKTFNKKHPQKTINITNKNKKYK